MINTADIYRLDALLDVKIVVQILVTGNLLSQVVNLVCVCVCVCVFVCACVCGNHKFSFPYFLVRVPRTKRKILIN